MGPKQFGKLIAALRREQRDEQNHECTQACLAKLVGVSEQIIGKIERGEKVTYEADLLVNLANAFRLSSRERKEFFLAAVGLDERDIPRPAHTPEQILNSLIAIMTTTVLPALIVDAYDDVVAINSFARTLFDFTDELQREAPHLVGGFNIMRVVFSKKSKYRDALAKEQRERCITQNLQFFKTITLPHRASPYFAYLLKGFRKDKDMSLFNAYYAESMHGDSEDFYIEDEVLIFNHEKLGRIRCYSPSMEAVTAAGALYLLIYIPADLQTLRVFSQLAEACRCGTGVVRLAGWPHKPAA